MLADLSHLDTFRIQQAPYFSKPGNPWGAFLIPSNVFPGQDLRCLSSNGMSGRMAWDHVSVSLAHRCPLWEEMDYIKRLFFRVEEWAFQLHAPPAEHYSLHPYTLHLWRPHRQVIPVPPKEML